MVFVPAGEYWTETPDGWKKLNVGAFWIDRTAVTVAAYSMCKECVPAAGRYFCFWGKPDRQNYPVNCVTWWNAMSYCHRQGKRLPRDPEWEKAARGTDGRSTPWGARKLVTDVSANWEPEQAPVDAYPEAASPYGVLDMFGHYEWVDPPLEFEVSRERHYDPQTGVGILRGREVTGHQEAEATLTGYNFSFRCVKDADSIRC
jgi:formylglycine-generating enzyme required for sulfatase activity